MKIENVTFPWHKTAFEVISKDGTANFFLKAWLDKHRIEYNIVQSNYGLPCVRNASAERFLERAPKLGLENLCLIDADMMATNETEAILIAKGDLIYCGYSNGKARCLAHWGHEDLGCGCMRASLDVLKSIEPPWFNFQMNKKGTAVTLCECRYFLRKAQAAGFESRMVGAISHLSIMAVRPDPNDPRKTLAAYPVEVLSRGEEQRRTNSPSPRNRSTLKEPE